MTRPPLRRARLALWVERLTPALAPAAAWLGLGLIAALLDVAGFLPGWGHAAALAVWSLGLIAALILGLRRLTPPRPDEVVARIERASELPHRPLSSLADRPAGADPLAQALWAAHRDRLLAALPPLRFGWPRSTLLRRDPFALRQALALLLVVAAVIAGPEAPQRLAAALRPDLSALNGPPPSLDLWLTPPAYVGAPPLLLSGLLNGAMVKIPAGATLSGVVNGAGAAPRVTQGEASAAFAAAGPETWKIDGAAVVDGPLQAVLGRRVLGHWILTLIPDAPPQARFSDGPAPGRRQTLHFGYAAEDDYGVMGLTLELRRGEEIRALPLAVPSERRSLSGTLDLDLTDHDWAGLPVWLRLVARDAINQSGDSPWIEIPLPERLFRHPVARALIEQRRALGLNPQGRGSVVAALDKIAAQPDAFNGDAGVFLGLISAKRRLALRAKDPAAAAETRDLLWLLAVRLEDGALGDRERDLRAAEQALRDALARNAPDAEIEKLAAELRAALDRYLEALAQQPGRPRSPAQDAQTRRLSRDELQKMVDKARDLSRQGQRDAAQAMLDQMRDLVDKLQPGGGRDAQNGDDAADAQSAPELEALSQLQGLARRQQDVMDQTLRAQQNRREALDPQLEREQQALREALGEMMRGLGESGRPIPQGLGKADQAMRQALEQLKRQQPGRAGAGMGEALEQMRGAARELVARLKGQTQGEGPAGASGAPGQDGLDPMGRPNAQRGQAGGDGIKIPSDNQVRRAREILDELRRRAGDPDRPSLERDYLDRLLKRF